MSDGDRALFLDIREERTLVVGYEVEDTVLIGDGEGHAEDACLLGRSAFLLLELDTVERRQHAELELELIGVGHLEIPPAVPHPLRDGDGVSLL